MSLVGALYVGASGLEAASTELSVVGDNIANSGTVGFKSARTVFADAMAQQMVGETGQLGLGITTMTVQKLFSQGGFTTTSLATDLAVQGNGLFVLKGNHGGEDGTDQEPALEHEIAGETSRGAGRHPEDAQRHGSHRCGDMERSTGVGTGLGP